MMPFQIDSDEFLKLVHEKKHIHFVGIGGVSMSALAELLHSMGNRISGSDRVLTPITSRLSSVGIEIAGGHSAENVRGADAIVRTAAVDDLNPEIKEARRLGVPVIERAEAWGAIMRRYGNAWCVSGTHGKTTATSMAAHIALKAGLDPTVMVGGYLPLIGGTLRIGAENLIIAESCEYVNSFLKFSPTVAVVLNVDADHLDFYSGIEDIIASFHAFLCLVPEHGAAVFNFDDPNAVKAADGILCRRVTFGFSSAADVTPENIRQTRPAFFAFDAMHRGEFFAHISLSVPGRHHILNALACAASAIALNIPADAVSQGIGEFKGANRRFEFKGRLNGADIFDDYAHHPKELLATLGTASEMGYRRVLCAFQPHTYSRTKKLFSDFSEALSHCDRAFIADIYAAREVNSYEISSKDLANSIENAVYTGGLSETARALAAEAREGDLILTVGAGDVSALPGMLLSR